MGLFTPAWMTEDPKKKDRAVAHARQEKNQDKLARIACEAPLEEVAAAAVEGLNDQAALERVARTSAHRQAALAACARISGDEALGELAISAPDEDCRREAAKRVKDPQTLARIIREGEGFAKGCAISKITDTALLREIAMNDATHAGMAARRITDPGVLLDIVRASSSDEARSSALYKLSDDTGLIFETLEKDPSDTVRKSAFRLARDRIKRKTVLTDAQRAVLRQALISMEDDGKESYMTEKIYEGNPLAAFDSFPEELRQIRREALREEIRAYAGGRLTLSMDADELLEFCREAGAKRQEAEKDYIVSAWEKALDETEDRLRCSFSGNPGVLLSFIEAPGCCFHIVDSCMEWLFSKWRDDKEGIEEARDRAVAAYLANIPAYGEQRPKHDERYCVIRLAGALGEKGRKKYGIGLKETSRRDSIAATGLFIGFSVDYVEITFLGKTYEERKTGGVYNERN